MTVYYACTDRAVPAGGVKVIYRHVDILNRNGIEAYVLHERPPFRCSWFPNSTPVRYWTSEASPAHPAIRTRVRARLGFRDRAGPRERLHVTRPAELPLDADDVLVLPEGFGPRLAEIAPGVSKVIFNQNAYRTFHGWPLDLARVQSPYLAPEVRAVVAISEDNRRYLQLAFPDLNIVRLHYSYDPAVFPFVRNGRRQLAYMPRKNSHDAAQVLLMLRLRGALDGWSVAPIDGVTEAEVSEVLQESSVFLSFGHPEGCPLPPAEAMLAGAVVVGYHGMGGREYLRSEHAYPIETGDITAFVQTCERLLREDPAQLDETAERAAAFIQKMYSPEREEAEVVAFWRELFR
jgi:glycosyltransferase involved in cell wall biosynthesis